MSYLTTFERLRREPLGEQEMGAERQFRGRQRTTAQRTTALEVRSPCGLEEQGGEREI